MSIPINISGSRAAAILSLSQYSTPVSVWLEIKGREFCEKNNYEFPEFLGNAATRFGSAFESAIINYTEKKLNLKIIDREKVFEDGFMTCHIDGSANNEILIENKTAYSGMFYNSWGDEGTDQIPQIYQVQVQHNLYLTKFKKCILPVLFLPVRQDEMLNNGIIPEEIDTEKWVEVLAEMGFLKFYEIFPNPELQKKMIAHYTEYWNRYIIGDEIPEMRTYDDIKALCRNPVGTIVADERIERFMEEYKNIGSEIAGSGPLAKRRDEVKIEILKYMNESERVEDEDSADKWLLLGTDGKKLASYSKNKNGSYIFR